MIWSRNPDHQSHPRFRHRQEPPFEYIGHDLQRPECILAEPDGTLWSADARGGVVRIAPDGTQQIITQRSPEHFSTPRSEAQRYLQGTLPNGLAFARNGDFLISNFGTDCLEIMSRDGTSRVLADTHRRRADRQGEFRAARFAGSDLDHGLDADQELDARAAHRSRRRLPRALRGRRASASSPTAFVSPTRSASTPRKSSCTSSRRPAAASRGCASTSAATSTEREIFGPRSLGKGAWPDGIAFDSYGNLWGTLVYSDKLFVLTPQGDLRVLLDEGDPAEGATRSSRRSSRTR